MKHLLKLITLTAIIIVAVTVNVFSQDTASAVASGGSDIVGSIIQAVEGKWPVIASVGSALFLLSELLAAIPAVKANSVFQLIQGWLSKLKK